VTLRPGVPAPNPQHGRGTGPSLTSSQGAASSMTPGVVGPRPAPRRHRRRDNRRCSHGILIQLPELSHSVARSPPWRTAPRLARGAGITGVHLKGSYINHLSYPPSRAPQGQTLRAGGDNRRTTRGILKTPSSLSPHQGSSSKSVRSHPYRSYRLSQAPADILAATTSLRRLSAARSSR
jgi:hypothetical protein